MRRVVLLMTWIGMALMLISASAIVWSSYAQWRERQEWDSLFSASTDISASRDALPKQSRSKLHHKELHQTNGSAIARLSMPRLDRELFVFAGQTTANLSKGPAWLTETGFPGKSGNCVIAGHRDTHFRFLKDVKSGDEITIQVPPHVYRYRVRSIQVVEPSNTRLLKPDSRPVLTLVTCYPFTYVGVSPRRFIVRAELAHEEVANNVFK